MIEHPNCKINLGLYVVRRRNDGYHDLETLFIPVPLHDRLEINPSTHFSFRQTGIDVGCSPDDNIIVNAFKLMRKVCGTRLPDVEIHLDKEIPFGAGLGGGSSDAAFTLRMLNDLFDLGFDKAQLKALCAKLGADSAFFIDNKAAYATGIGDQLELLDSNPLDGYTILLVKPDEAVSTAEAYRGITPRNMQNNPQGIDLRDAVKRPISEWKNLIVNDFEPNVFAHHPRLETIKRQLYDQGALYASMSGSGATVYGIFPSYSGIEYSLENHFEKYGNTYIYKL